MLRDLIKKKHDAAESQLFVKYLFGGNIDKKHYAEYLQNQYYIYYSLELKAEHILKTMPGLERKQKIQEDLKELDEYELKIMPSTVAYIDYLQNTELSDEDIMAHIYVRHMGDLFGGQMIKKVIPGSGHTYEFENRSELIQAIRSKLNDNMAEEANCVFDFAIGLFEDLAHEYNL